MEEELLSTGEAAKRCAVTPDAVLKWIKTGRLRARRTPGGHYRIPVSELERHERSRARRGFHYCWEYNSRHGRLRDGCRQCFVYLVQAIRCYEVAAMNLDPGHSRTFCEMSCEDCEYYHLIRNQETRILVLSEHEGLREDLTAQAVPGRLDVEVVDCEYRLAAMLEQHRPDFVVIDCRIGKERAEEVAGRIREDPRAEDVRIILAREPGESRPEKGELDDLLMIECPCAAEAILRRANR